MQPRRGLNSCLPSVLYLSRLFLSSHRACLDLVFAPPGVFCLCRGRPPCQPEQPERLYVCTQVCCSQIVFCLLSYRLSAVRAGTGACPYSGCIQRVKTLNRALAHLKPRACSPLKLSLRKLRLCTAECTKMRRQAKKKNKYCFFLEKNKTNDLHIKKNIYLCSRNEKPLTTHYN